MLCISDRIADDRFAAKFIYFTHEEHRIPPHWHTNLELKYIAAGKNEIYIDGKRYLLSAGDIGVVNRGSVHFTRQVGSCNIRGLTIVFSNEYFRKICPDFEDSSFSPVLLREKTPAVFEILEDIYGLFDKNSVPPHKYELNPGNSYEYLRVLGQVNLLAYHLITQYREESKSTVSLEGSRYRERFYQIASYIEKHYMDEIDASTIASHFGLTREYFSRSFKSHMGVTYLDYLNDVRLSEAHRQLVYTDETMSNIAANCGFADVRAFNRCFRKQYSQSPSEYRRNIVRTR